MLFSTMFCQKLLDTFIFMTEFSFFVLYSEFKEDGEKLTIEKIDDKEDDKLNKGNNCRHKHSQHIFFFCQQNAIYMLGSTALYCQ